jgi:hypothetical protein
MHIYLYYCSSVTGNFCPSHNGYFPNHVNGHIKWPQKPHAACESQVADPCPRGSVNKHKDCGLLGCDIIWTCGGYQRFVRMYHLYLQVREDGGGNLLQVHVVSQSKRPQSTFSLLWKPQSHIRQAEVLTRKHSRFCVSTIPLMAEDLLWPDIPASLSAQQQLGRRWMGIWWLLA